MRRAILAASLGLLLSCGGGEEAPQTWEEAPGIAGVPRDIAATDDGGCILVGSQGDQMLVVKLGADGKVEWERTFGGPYADEALSVVPLSDGYLVLGYSAKDETGMNEEAVVLKLSPGGDSLWATEYTGAYSERAIGAALSGSSALVVGHTNSMGGATQLFAITVSLDDGGITSEKVYGTQDEERPSGITETQEGILAYGYRFGDGTGWKKMAWAMQLSRSGDSLWAGSWSGDQEGDYELLGGDGNTLVGIAKIGPGVYPYAVSVSAGSPSWQVVGQEGDTLWDLCGSMGVGTHEADIGLFEVGSGGISLMDTYGTPEGAEGGRAIAETGDGTYFIAGYKDGEIYVLKVAP